MSHVRTSVAMLVVTAVLGLGGSSRLHRLSPTHGEEHLQFGYELAVDGNTLIVGANQDGNAHGAAYAYSWGPNGWTDEARLVPSDRSEYAHFGMAVDVSGPNVIVGAHRHRQGVGAAYIYTATPTGWAEIARLTPSQAERGMEFGEAVAIDGDDAVVAAAFADAAGVVDQGRVFVFRNQSGWAETQVLTAPDGHETSYFGQSVAIRGGHIFVGSGDHRISGGPRVGAVWVFQRDTLGVWQYTERLSPSDLQDGDAFGVSISSDGSRLAIGAENGFRGDISTGAVYLFEHTDQGWQQDARITANDAIGAEFFGARHAVAGDTIVVGAWQAMASGTYAQGAAYRFEKRRGSWVEVQKFLAPDGGDNHFYGHGIALDGGRVVIGASGAEGAGGPQTPYVGAVYTLY